MKAGWEYKTLGEVCKIYNGNSINADYKKKHFLGATGGLPFIATKDVSPLGTIDYNNGVRIPNYEEYKVAPANSVFICAEGGSAGKKFAYVEKDVCFGNKLFCITPKDKAIKGKFIYHFVQSDNFRGQFFSLLTGLIGGVSAKKFQTIEIPVPSLSEQQSIVDYLDSAFAKIDAMKANAEKALNEVKALFQTSLKEMLEPKEGWEEKTLGDICEIKSILVDPTEIQYKNLLHVGGANIVSETGELIDLKTAAEEELTSGKFTFNDKDVLYNKIRPYLIKVSRPDFSGLCSADMYPLTSKKGMTRDFLYYILVSRNFTEYAIMNSARAGMPKLNRQSLFAYKCMIPPLSEQQSIVATLDSLKSKVDRLQENYDKIPQECDALKQAILRQVFE